MSFEETKKTSKPKGSTKKESGDHNMSSLGEMSVIGVRKGSHTDMPIDNDNEDMRNPYDDDDEDDDDSDSGSDGSSDS